MNDARRLRNMQTMKGTSQFNLEVERSKCQVCLGSNYCCRHREAAEMHGRVIETLTCVCGKGCTYTREEEIGY